MPKKEYTKVPIKQKNGRIVNIVKLTRTCPICGFPMYIIERRKGGVHKRAKVFWACNEKKCGYRELEEGELDRLIREGCYDKKIGILPLTDTDFLTNETDEKV